MASVINNLFIWGSSSAEYNGSVTTSSGVAQGFSAGKPNYAQNVNLSFRNATIVQYGLAEILASMSSVPGLSSNLTLGYGDIDSSSLPAFVSAFKAAFDYYITNGAGTVNSANNAASAALAAFALQTSQFNSDKTITLTGPITGAFASTGFSGWTISTSITNGSIKSEHLSANAVISAKLATSAVTTAKISAGAVTNIKIANPYISFYNGTTLTPTFTTSVSLGSSVKMNELFGFNAVDSGFLQAGLGNISLVSQIYFNFYNSNYSYQLAFPGSTTAQLYQLFGFNSASGTGGVRFNSSTMGFEINPDTEGEPIEVIPNNYISGVSYYKAGNFPKATIIGKSAFQGCTGLSSISCPKVEYIAESAFNGCTSLGTNLNFPKLIEIKSNAFENCSNKLFTFSAASCNNIWNSAFKSCKYLETVSFPACTYIGNDAFLDCRSLSNIYIPNCTNLTNAFVSVGSSTTSVCIDLHLTNTITGRIGSDTENISAPIAENYKVYSCYIDNLRGIPSHFFNNCHNLRSLKSSDVANNLSSCIVVEDYAFLYCTNLRSIDLPNCSYMGIFAFRNCEKLGLNGNPINLNKLTSVPYGAFYNCYSIGTIVLSYACSEIQNYAFYNCSALSSLYLYTSSVISLGASAFTGTKIANGEGWIRVPQSLVTAYKQAWTSMSLYIQSIGY